MFSLKKHYDLIPNLVEVVKGYKEYEAFVLENVVKARTDAINQSSISVKAQAENILSESLKSFLLWQKIILNLKHQKIFKNFKINFLLLKMIYNQQGDIITQPLENLIMLYKFFHLI